MELSSEFKGRRQGKLTDRSGKECANNGVLASGICYSFCCSVRTNYRQLFTTASNKNVNTNMRQRQHTDTQTHRQSQTNWARSVLEEPRMACKWCVPPPLRIGLDCVGIAHNSVVISRPARQSGKWASFSTPRQAQSQLTLPTRYGHNGRRCKETDMKMVAFNN